MFFKPFVKAEKKKKEKSYSTLIWTSSSLSGSWILIFACASDLMSGIVCVSLMAQILFSAVETLRVCSFLILQCWPRN